MSFKCFLDLDGVLADFTGGAAKHFGVPDPYNQSGTVRGPEAWDTPGLMGIEPDGFWSSLDYDFWRHLDKHAEADGILAELRRQFRRDEICFLSAAGTRHPGCLEAKRDWCDEHFPGIPLLLAVAVPGGEPPKNFCASRDALLIDDSDANVNAFRDAGGKAWLVPRPWNTAWESETWLLEELRDHLESSHDRRRHRISDLPFEVLESF